ncbi:MAG: AAA family ATPase [Ruminococcus sp.]|nr:AAA family ATPase [Ruminococcus sp.]
MNYKNDNLEELLEYIDPSELDYQQWCGVGMALKDADYDVSVWDTWSMRDAARYHQGECKKKWSSFNGSDTPVTAGTIVHLAIQGGFRPMPDNIDKILDWNDVIGEEYTVTSAEDTQELPIHEPKVWEPASEIRRYLEALFDMNDIVGYVTEVWKDEADGGKFKPKAGSYDRTAGQLLQELARYGGDIESVFGTINEECGAWIRFNPLNGQGVKNDCVADYRYALVESDSIPVAQQNGIMHDLKLPIAALVFTGGKSLHAIVRVEAGSFKEYRERVEFLYKICDKNGLHVDRNCRNPSRLSRMPGVMRNGKKQFLVETNSGFSSWQEWKEWIESVNDDLPDFEDMSDAWENMPELAPPLIENVLRQGHKMLLAGPSKAGKSFALIELAIAIAEGRKWLGWQCAKGKVLYVNLELDKASCLHRVKDVYNALKIPPQNLHNLRIWNLRGMTKPMDKLAPSLIWRAKRENFLAVIIDPIYKVITGDENSADQMAHFCNQFDKVCTALGCAVIYCHHHSKGSQGGKRSMDRASGSGVFARDPDALLDMVELELTEDIRKQLKNNEGCLVCADYLNRYAPDVARNASPDDLLSRSASMKLCCDNLSRDNYEAFKTALSASDAYIDSLTAWRMEGTLREFPKFQTKNLYFRYPIHDEDKVGVLKDLQTDDMLTSYQRGAKRGHAKQSANAKAKAADKNAELINTFNAVNVDGKVSVQEIAEYLGVDRRTIERRLQKSNELALENGIVARK